MHTLEHSRSDRGADGSSRIGFTVAKFASPQPHHDYPRANPLQPNLRPIREQ